MFSPWFPSDVNLGLHPGVLVRTEGDGSTVVTLTDASRVVSFVFHEAIAFYCVEESIFECSSIPGLPRDEDFLSYKKFARNSPVWRSPINFRRGHYGHLESYRPGASLESFIFIGQDYVVLVESIGSVDVQTDTGDT